uniref:Oxysterol binding protein like 2 n=1 Tax=Pipistrellus kuhlii TaxID=59472 RepID=A0A7J7RT87_PIPKU|nr:oxysterol binding protein like 2 [Pipistrellus kuhlii]
MNGDEEFFDAVTGFDSDNSSGEFSEASQKAPGRLPVDTSKSNGIGEAGERPPQENGIQRHRTSLPAPMFTRSDFSVWGILKKCIGLGRPRVQVHIRAGQPPPPC